MRRYVLGFLIGTFLTYGAFHIPKEPASYVVKTTERCLTPEGVSFSMRYSGLGTVNFLVVPPDEAKPQKEKKK